MTVGANAPVGRVTLRQRVARELPSVLIVALVFGLPFALLARQSGPLIGAVGIFVVLVSFGEVASIDRTVFASIAIPAGTVALLGLALPWRLAVVFDEVVAFFLALFVFTDGRFTTWWFRVVLRRRRIAFALALSSQLREMVRSSALSRGDNSQRAFRSFERQIIRLRSLRAPDADWAELRDAQADEWEAVRELAWRSAGLEAFQEEAVRAQALQARFHELLARENPRMVPPNFRFHDASDHRPANLDMEPLDDERKGP